MAARIATMIVVCLLSFAPAAAPASGAYPRHEAWLGFGGATSFEKSVLNAPNDIASTPEGAVTLGYFVNLDARRAVGFHLYGGTEMTNSVLLQSSAGNRRAEFELDTYNLGVRYRYTFARGTLVPYAFVGGSLVGGLLSGGGLSDLGCSGASACAGPGAGVRLGRNFMFSMEGIGSLGVANWERSPLPNSTGRKFNPSLAGGTVNLSVVWGAPPASPPIVPSPVRSDSSLASGATAIEDTGLAATAFAAPGAGITSRRTNAGFAAEIVLSEAVLALFSSAAYDDEKGTLPGLTIGAVLLGTMAGGDFKSPKSPWLMLGGMAAITTAEFILANSGASQDALFATSMVSWNVVVLAIGLEERKAGRRN